VRSFTATERAKEREDETRSLANVDDGLVSFLSKSEEYNPKLTPSVTDAYSGTYSGRFSNLDPEGGSSRN
jgi:hypothetical protein